MQQLENTHKSNPSFNQSKIAVKVYTHLNVVPTATQQTTLALNKTAQLGFTHVPYVFQVIRQYYTNYKTNPQFRCITNTTAKHVGCDYKLSNLEAQYYIKLFIELQQRSKLRTFALYDCKFLNIEQLTCDHIVH